MKLVTKNDYFEMHETGRSYDFIATVQNTTDSPITISFDSIDQDPYGYCPENFEVAPRDWVGLLADENGWATFKAIKNGDFSVESRDLVHAAEIQDNAVNMAHCDWIIDKAKELKALLAHGSESMLVANKTRALSGIDTMMDSLRELKLCIKEVAEKKPPLEARIQSAEQKKAETPRQPVEHERDATRE